MVQHRSGVNSTKMSHLYFTICASGFICTRKKELSEEIKNEFSHALVVIVSSEDH